MVTLELQLETFEEVVAALQGLRPALTHGLARRLPGPLPCPAPPWDDGGEYRIQKTSHWGLDDLVIEVHDDNVWREVPLPQLLVKPQRGDFHATAVEACPDIPNEKEARAFGIVRGPNGTALVLAGGRFETLKEALSTSLEKAENFVSRLNNGELRPEWASFAASATALSNAQQSGLHLEPAHRAFSDARDVLLLAYAKCPVA